MTDQLTTERGPYLSGPGQVRLLGITEEELAIWSDERRPRGKPSVKSQVSYAERDRIILQITQMVTEQFPQTIRHIYYVCSGLRLVGKDHGKHTYWYNQVADIIGEARWAGTANSNTDEAETLDWKKIVDDSRYTSRY